MSFTCWKAEGVGLLYSREEKAEGDIINVYKYLKGGREEDGSRLLTAMLTEKMRGNRYKLKHGCFYLDIRKKSFTVMVNKLLQILPEEVLESLSLEVFKSCLDVVGQPALGEPVWMRRGQTRRPAGAPSNLSRSVILWKGIKLKKLSGFPSISPSY